MSILDELEDSGDSGAHARPPSLLDELSGDDVDGDAKKADVETEIAAKKEIGQELRMALKGNDDLALFDAIAKVLAFQE